MMRYICSRDHLFPLHPSVLTVRSQLDRGSFAFCENFAHPKSLVSPHVLVALLHSPQEPQSISSGVQVECVKYEKT
jgi:hypothetical protein